MIFGYTPLDPLVVLGGTFYTGWLLKKNAVRLIGFLPMALSLYFFIPFMTYLTLWQTVPLVLTVRTFLKGSFKASPRSKPVLTILIMALIWASLYALVGGDDHTRALIRAIYYLGVLAIFSFCYEFGQRDGAYHVFLKGLALVGIIYSLYGLYQIVATPIGLPVRGIVRGTYGADMAYEYGFVRINSFANEPKRLGYVLFVSALACFFLASNEKKTARKWKLAGGFVLLMSLFTFAGSYFLSVALFILVSTLIYPTRLTKYFAVGAIALVAISYAIPSLGLIEAIQHGYERRLNEVEVGLDGDVVYRQEFFAWDYLKQHPIDAISGVGIGQYFSVLSKEYGPGVGYNEYGRLLPLNSAFLEMILDLSGIIAIIFYCSIAVLIWKLRRAGERFLCLSLLFLAVQSFTILTLQFMVMFAGIGLARLSVAQAKQRTRPLSLDDAKKPTPA
ncbi:MULTISPECIES: hypothetical protein [Pseudomonadota]|uniref:hypothetical protein n=1 Tax=Pseudomonadota TaxID=1224 RepID=UPI003A92C9EE